MVKAPTINREGDILPSDEQLFPVLWNFKPGMF